MAISRMGRAGLARLLMLVIGVVATPNVGLASMQRPHCVQHERRTNHDRQATGPGATAENPIRPTWIPRHYHECPHCPASECARIAPCAGTVIVAATPASAAVTSLTGHRVASEGERERAHSASSPPSTPPPQLIA